MPTIKMCEQIFAGPTELTAPRVRRGVPGVFAIICECKDGAKRMVDVGHAESMDQLVADRKNIDRWEKPYQGRLTVYVWYCEPDNPSLRQELVEAIAKRYFPICAR